MSKLTGAGIHALRYYERKNLLKPAYTDPESGYRYYSIDQIFFVEIIMFCVELDIPLKELANFVDADDTVDFQNFFAQGKEIAERKLKSLKSRLNLINEIEQGIALSKLHRDGKIYSKEIPEKIFYVKPCGCSVIEDKNLLEIAKLFKDIEDVPYYEDGYGLLEFGFLCEYSPAGRQHYVFAEFPKKVAGENIMVIPAGTYFCKQSTAIQLDKAPEIFSEYLAGRDSYLAIETDIFTGKSKINNPLCELRVIATDYSCKRPPGI